MQKGGIAVLTAKEIVKRGGPWDRAEIIGNTLLLQGDCLSIMPLLDPVDACLTDPPYGIRYDRAAASGSGRKSGKGFALKGEYRATSWDDITADEAVDAAISMSGSAIVFGGNYYRLPPSPGWLVWDKEVNGNFADCELAWTNINQPVRRLRHMWNGGIRKGQEQRHGHPTQKPIALMEWCLGFLPNAETILDPFAGSGATGVACVNLGRKFIGIERDPEYFEIMCRRIDEAHRQADLFVEKPAAKPAPTQEGFDL